jgi:hypothetical protein
MNKFSLNKFLLDLDASDLFAIKKMYEFISQL